MLSEVQLDIHNKKPALWTNVVRPYHLNVGRQFQVAPSEHPLIDLCRPSTAGVGDEMRRSLREEGVGLSKIVGLGAVEDSVPVIVALARHVLARICLIPTRRVHSGLQKKTFFIFKHLLCEISYPGQ